MSIKYTGNALWSGIERYRDFMLHALTLENIRWYVFFTALRSVEMYQWLLTYWYFPVFGVVWVRCHGGVVWPTAVMTMILVMISRATVGKKDLAYIFVTRTTGMMILWTSILFVLYHIGNLIILTDTIRAIACVLLLMFPHLLFVASLPCVVVALWMLDAKFCNVSLIHSFRSGMVMIMQAYPFLVVLHTSAWGILKLITMILNFIVSPEMSLYGSAVLILPVYIAGIAQWYTMTRYHS